MLRQSTFLIFMNQNFQFMIFTLANDHFIVWSSSVTLTFNLPEEMFQMKNCAHLFWNPCINVEVLAQTNSMTILSFDLQVWPWPLIYLNKWFKWTTVPIFWNQCINVEHMAQTSSIYDHFIIWPSTFNLREQMFLKWHCYSSRTTVPNYFEIHA